MDQVQYPICFIYQGMNTSFAWCSAWFLFFDAMLWTKSGQSWILRQLCLQNWLSTMKSSQTIMTTIDSEIYSNLMNYWVSLTDHTKNAQLWNMMRWKDGKECNQYSFLFKVMQTFLFPRKTWLMSYYINNCADMIMIYDCIAVTTIMLYPSWYWSCWPICYLWKQIWTHGVRCFNKEFQRFATDESLRAKPKQSWNWRTIFAHEDAIFIDPTMLTHKENIVVLKF